MLESIAGNGKLKPTSAKAAFEEFEHYDIEASRSLRSIPHIQEQNPPK